MSKVINHTSGNLRNYTKSQISDIKNLVADTAVAIELEATRKAPRDLSGNKDLFINIDKKFYNNGLSAEVGVMGENKLAAYFEFGTGLSAREILSGYPQWVKDIAMKFYVNGMGTLKGKPYLFPAFFKNNKIFQSKLSKIMKGGKVNDL